VSLPTVTRKLSVALCVFRAPLHVVMVGKQGVTSRNRTKSILLNLVKESMDTKEVPVIILCNRLMIRTTRNELDSSPKLA
jgi:hypothetical protein